MAQHKLLSRRTQSSIAAVVLLATSESQHSCAKLARRSGVSGSYMEQIIAPLRDAGIVRGVRGPGGGYVLDKDPDEISIAEIIEICRVEDSIPDAGRLEAMTMKFYRGVFISDICDVPKRDKIQPAGRSAVIAGMFKTRRKVA